MKFLSETIKDGNYTQQYIELDDRTLNKLLNE